MKLIEECCVSWIVALVGCWRGCWMLMIFSFSASFDHVFIPTVDSYTTRPLTFQTSANPSLQTPDHTDHRPPGDSVRHGLLIAKTSHSNPQGCASGTASPTGSHKSPVPIARSNVAALCSSSCHATQLSSADNTARGLRSVRSQLNKPF